MDNLPGPLRESLRYVAEAMRGAHDPWWIIASAAMALHGASPIDVADVDLLASERDAEALIAALGIAQPPPAISPRFRSAIFVRWEEPPLPVEIMAGFEVHSPNGWHMIRPKSRVAVDCGDIRLFVPDVPELIAQCHRYGRDKDRQRATLLQRLIAE